MMKVEISESGMLEITPETPIEVYALKCWWAAFSPAISVPEQQIKVGIGAGIGIKNTEMEPK